MSVSANNPARPERGFARRTERAADAVDAQGRWQLFWTRFRADRAAVAGLGAIALIAVLAVAAPLVVQMAGAHPPDAQSPAAVDGYGSPLGPGGAYLFGADALGRDVFSRTVYGTRASLEVALVATTTSVLLGTLLGVISGFVRGVLGTLIARGFDLLLAFPVLLFALGLGAACSLGGGCLPVSFGALGIVLFGAGALWIGLGAWRRLRRGRRGAQAQAGTVRLRSGLAWLGPGAAIAVVGLGLFAHGGTVRLIRPGLAVVVLVVALYGIPYVGRVVRGQVLSLSEQEFIEAARMIGASRSRILRRHILPNLTSTLVVLATVLVPQAVLYEAALSFLGVGIQPPTASWGAMIASSISIFTTAWWTLTFPGAALVVTVLSFNLVGDGVQSALDRRIVR